MSHRSLFCFALVLTLLDVGQVRCRTRETDSPTPPLQFVTFPIPVCDPETPDCKARIMARETERMLVFRSSSHEEEITIQGIKKGTQNVAIPGSANFYEGEASFGAKPRFQHLKKVINWKPILSVFNLQGFSEMCCLDPFEFNETNYDLEYLGGETLLGEHYWVFCVKPKKHAKGRHFEGRIWVSPDCLAIVRVEGSFHPMRKILWYFPVEDHWYTFNSWWKEISHGNWALDFICTGVSFSESDLTNRAFRARITYHTRAGTLPSSDVDHACGMDSVLFRIQVPQPKSGTGQFQK